MTAKYVDRCCQTHKDSTAQHRLSELAVIAIVDILDVPVHRWPGNCHAIASKILEENIFSGKLQYGLYTGPIHKKSIFYATGRTAVRHGWIRSDNTIIDPTRWVFEYVTPYIYVGPVDEAEYDFGMSEIRKFTRLPFESLDLTVGRQTKYKIPADLLDLVGRLTTIAEQGTDSLQTIQLCWLAGAGLEELGADAKKLYTWLDSLGLKYFVPIDFWNEVMG